MKAMRDREWQGPRPLMEEWTWQYAGRCRQLSPEVFFPEHALAMRETHGVWGAMSARDRVKHLAARSA